MSAQKLLTIAKDPNEPQTIEVMEKAILQISEAATKLLNSRLTKRAITTLIHDDCKVPRRDIELVLETAKDLAKTYLKR